MKQNARLSFDVWNSEKYSIITKKTCKTPRIYHKTAFYGSFLKLSFSIKEKALNNLLRKKLRF